MALPLLVPLSILDSSTASDLSASRASGVSIQYIGRAPAHRHQHAGNSNPTINSRFISQQKFAREQVMNDRIQFLKPTRRRVLKGTVAAAASAWWLGAGSTFGMAAARSSATAGNQPIPSGLITQVPMTVSAATVGVVTPGFAGLAYPKEKILGNLFTGMDSSLITLFRLLGPSSLRLGGSTVDQSVWTPNGSGGQQGQVAPADVDNLAAFLKATNWTCIYGINLAGAATGATTPAMAAEEAAYVAARLGPALAAIEIGNEPDLYGG